MFQADDRSRGEVLARMSFTWCAGGCMALLLSLLGRIVGVPVVPSIGFLGGLVVLGLWGWWLLPLTEPGQGAGGHEVVRFEVVRSFRVVSRVQVRASGAAAVTGWVLGGGRALGVTPHEAAMVFSRGRPRVLVAGPRTYVVLGSFRATALLGGAGAAVLHQDGGAPVEGERRPRVPFPQLDQQDPQPPLQ